MKKFAHSGGGVEVERQMLMHFIVLLACLSAPVRPPVVLAFLLVLDSFYIRSVLLSPHHHSVVNCELPTHQELNCK